MMWIFDGVCCFAVEMSRRYCIHWFDRFVRLISKLCLVQNKVYLCGFTWSFIQQTPKCNLFSLVRSLSWKGSCIMYYSSLCYTYKSPLHCATVTRGKDWLESVAWPKWLQCVCIPSLMLLKRLLQRWYAPTCSRLRSSKQLWWARTAQKTAIKRQWDEVSLSEHTEILL